MFKKKNKIFLLFVGFTFAAKSCKSQYKIDKNEILNVKWLYYEELISMNKDLRLYYWIIDALQT